MELWSWPIKSKSIVRLGITRNWPSGKAGQRITNPVSYEPKIQNGAVFKWLLRVRWCCITNSVGNHFWSIVRVKNMTTLYPNQLKLKKLNLEEKKKKNFIQGLKTYHNITSIHANSVNTNWIIVLWHTALLQQKRSRSRPITGQNRWLCLVFRLKRYVH